MLYVIAKSIAKSDKIKETKEALESLIEPTRKEDGCQTYELLQDIDNAETFTFYELWESKAHLDAHLQQPHMIELAKVAKDLLIQPMEVSLLEKIQ